MDLYVIGFLLAAGCLYGFAKKVKSNANNFILLLSSILAGFLGWLFIGYVLGTQLKIEEKENDS